MDDITKPLKNVKWIEIDKLKANNYNPNEVSKRNLKLLKQSILNNGFTQPIVIKPDNTIIDGYHRWLVSKEDLRDKLNGKVPVVIVKHSDEAKDVYGTIAHNRARGTHQLEPMKKVIKQLLNKGKTIKEIEKQLGMSKEEIFRLSDITRKKFLELMTDGHKEYSKAKVILKV